MARGVSAPVGVADEEVAVGEQGIERRECAPHRVAVHCIAGRLSQGFQGKREARRVDGMGDIWMGRRYPRRERIDIHPYLFCGEALGRPGDCAAGQGREHSQDKSMEQLRHRHGRRPGLHSQSLKIYHNISKHVEATQPKVQCQGDSGSGPHPPVVVSGPPPSSRTRSLLWAGRRRLPCLPSNWAGPRTGSTTTCSCSARAGLCTSARAPMASGSSHLPVAATSRFGSPTTWPATRPLGVLESYVKGLLQVAESDFRAGLKLGAVEVEGSRRRLWAARNKGWLNQADLEEANALLERLCTLLSQPRDASRDLPMSLAFVLAPAAVRPSRRPSGKAEKG